MNLVACNSRAVFNTKMYIYTYIYGSIHVLMFIARPERWMFKLSGDSALSSKSMTPSFPKGSPSLNRSILLCGYKPVNRFHLGLFGAPGFEPSNIIETGCLPELRPTCGKQPVQILSKRHS